eukprot:scaffold241215_cov32-Tisochrysis_lutea.AAC.2
MRVHVAASCPQARHVPDSWAHAAKLVSIGLPNAQACTLRHVPLDEENFDTTARRGRKRPLGKSDDTLILLWIVKQEGARQLVYSKLGAYNGLS